MAQDFFSQHSIDDEVEFYPMYRQLKEMGIAPDLRKGTIVAVRFTKPKVFYDILDEYYGYVFKEVDSVKVFVPEKYTTPEQEDELLKKAKMMQAE